MTDTATLEPPSNDNAVSDPTFADRIFAPFAPFARWLGMDRAGGWIDRLSTALFVDCILCYTSRVIVLTALVASLLWAGVAGGVWYFGTNQPNDLGLVSSLEARVADAERGRVASIEENDKLKMEIARAKSPGRVVIRADDEWLRKRNGGSAGGTDGNNSAAPASK